MNSLDMEIYKRINKLDADDIKIVNLLESIVGLCTDIVDRLEALDKRLSKLERRKS